MTIGICKQTQFLNERIKQCKETGFVIPSTRTIPWAGLTLRKVSY